MNSQNQAKATDNINTPLIIMNLVGIMAHEKKYNV